MNLEEKIKYLLEINNYEFIFPEFYSHENSLCWKIKNSHTKYAEEVFVLGLVDEGFERSLDIAINIIEKRKRKNKML